MIHIAGLINAASRAGFEAVNVGGTAAMIDAARQAGVRRFVHISSLAAREPELSDYGWSKARSERVVAASGLDWTIVRPPAVYGPGDRETFELFKMARRGFVALPPRGRFSVIHVDDLARLILAVLDAPETYGETYEPDDGTENGWSHRHFARTLGRLFGKRAATVAMPKVVMQGAARVDRLVRRDKAKLTPDRVRYFCHPDWVVTAQARPPATLWRPRSAPPPASRQTAEWYRAQGWHARNDEVLDRRRPRSSRPARPGRSDRHSRASGTSCAGAPARSGRCRAPSSGRCRPRSAPARVTSSINSSSPIWVKAPKKSRLLCPPRFGRPVLGSTASTAKIAEKKAAPPRISSGSGAAPPRAWPIVIVKMTKVAPIRMLALVSAMAESWSWASWVVRIRCTALAG